MPTADDAEIFKDGWFYPGDIGKLMPDGLLVITGRVNEVINRGGDKLAPEVIEGALRLMPEIADAAVFAVPNTDQIWAAVVGKAAAAARSHPGFLQDEACRHGAGPHFRTGSHSP